VREVLDRLRKARAKQQEVIDLLTSDTDNPYFNDTVTGPKKKLRIILGYLDHIIQLGEGICKKS